MDVSHAVAIFESLFACLGNEVVFDDDSAMRLIEAAFWILAEHSREILLVVLEGILEALKGR
ncbi:hypothetical protein ACJO2E_08495 [Marinobacter sp. M1N3S26]|uniref:hypothetical protein n=1 Tax=Marinobacter sp. M1N3S26 TaxID=3382299 RepID=UPI00387ADC46